MVFGFLYKRIFFFKSNAQLFKSEKHFKVIKYVLISLPYNKQQQLKPTTFPGYD